MRIDPHDFPVKLRELREKADLTQTEAAKKIDSKYHRAWAAYEDTSKDHHREPTLSTAKKLLNALGYDLTITITKK